MDSRSRSGTPAAVSGSDVTIDDVVLVGVVLVSVVVVVAGAAAAVSVAVVVLAVETSSDRLLSSSSCVQSKRDIGSRSDSSYVGTLRAW